MAFRGLKPLLRVVVVAGIFCQEASGQSVTPLSAKADPSEPPLNLQLQEACVSGDLNQAKALLDQGAALEGADAQGRTPLMFAASNGYTPIVTLLLSKGAKVDTQDKDQFNALAYACATDKAESAMALLDAGADPNLISKTAAHRSPLGIAAYNGDIPLLSALLDHKAAINYTLSWGTAFGNAVLNNQWDAATFLLSKGADSNIPTANENLTTFMQAAEYSHGAPLENVQATQFLLKAGANPNLKSVTGFTALMYASRLDSEKLVQVLLDGGADINATDNLGETALTYAGDRGYQDMVDLLKSRGALRTDLHVISKDKSNPPLLPAQAWALAVGAMYNQRNGTNPHFLGGQDGRHQSIVQGDISRSLGIRSRSDLLPKLDYLSSTGDRAQNQKEGARLASMADDEFEASLGSDPQSADKMRAIRKSYLKWKEKSGLGWDLGYSVQLVNQGYDAGYLNEQECWSLLMALAQETQKNFSSWQEFGDNFLDGRAMNQSEGNSLFELCVKLLSNPEDQNSPWTQCPWNTPLSENATSGN